MKQSWKYGKLGDAVYKASSSISLNKIKNDDGDYPVFGAKGFAKNVSFYDQEKEYLGIIKDGAGIGRVKKYPSKSSIVATMQYILPCEGHDIDFIRYFLESLDFEIYRTGSTIPHIYFKNYKEAKFPLINIDEQKNIVKTLDEAFSKINQAKINVEKNIINSKELFHSKLHEIFILGSFDWSQKKVGEVAIHSLGKMLDKKKNTGNPKKYLRNKSVRWFGFDLESMSEMLFEENEIEKYTAVKGDVLICEGGYPGRAAIWDENYSIHFQKAIHRVRFKNSLYSKWFLYHLYFSDLSGDIKKYFTGTGIQHFTGRALHNYKIPFPPISQVVNLTKSIEKLDLEIKKIGLTYQTKRNNLNDLKKSILQKAFAGELTKMSKP